MKNFIEAAQYAFAALGGALGAVMGGFDGFLYIQGRRHDAEDIP